jgi:hypothetical protein
LPRVRRTEVELPLLETGAGFFFTTAFALDFWSDFAFRGADLAAFGSFAAFLATAGFFATGFLAAGLAAGFLTAFGAGLEDLGFALPGIAGREVCRENRR